MTSFGFAEAPALRLCSACGRSDMAELVEFFRCKVLLPYRQSDAEEKLDLIQAESKQTNKHPEEASLPKLPVRGLVSLGFCAFADWCRPWFVSVETDPNPQESPVLP